MAHRARLVYVPLVPSPESPRHLVECLLLQVLLITRRITPRPWSTREVWFRHAAPPSTEEHVRLLAPQVRFGRPTDEIRFDARLLEAPVPTHDPQLCAVLDRHVDTRLARLQLSEGLAGRVRDAVERALHEGEPRLERIARALRMSPRTLQRRLREEGGSFRRLVDTVRLNRALQDLADPDRTLGEIALSVGFSEPSAFHRAFRRWTGTTPLAYRARALAGATRAPPPAPASAPGLDKPAGLA